MQTVTLQYESLAEMFRTLTAAGARRAIELGGEHGAPPGQWVLAVFEVATGKRATAAAGRVVEAGRALFVEFERRDWARLIEFATPWGSADSDSIEEPPGESGAQRGARALVVEDERVSREMVTSFLLGLGLVVRPASTGERAVQLLQSETFDLAVLDVALPGISGLELCEAIRRRPDFMQSLPILILTADGSDEAAERSFRAGADDFITKPVPVLEFRARVLALLRRSRASIP